jgi:hypothetical protein
MIELWWWRCAGLKINKIDEKAGRRISLIYIIGEDSESLEAHNRLQQDREIRNSDRETGCTPRYHAESASKMLSHAVATNGNMISVEGHTEHEKYSLQF